MPGLDQEESSRRGLDGWSVAATIVIAMLFCLVSDVIKSRRSAYPGSWQGTRVLTKNFLYRGRQISIDLFPKSDGEYAWAFKMRDSDAF